MARVSVIIPAYNAAAYLPEAIESVFAQTYRDAEVVVVDDGSTDDTRRVLAPYRDRIVYLSQENQGESVARNRGIEVARAPYVAFLDADDFWLPHKLERQVAVLDASPEAVLVYAYSHIVDATGERIRLNGSDTLGEGIAGLHELFEALLLRNLIACDGAVLVRRRCLDRTQGFDPAIRWAEDWDLWLRLSLLGPFAFVPEALACYRMREPGRRLRIEASDDFVRQNEAILDAALARRSAGGSSTTEIRQEAFAALYLRSAMFNFELGDLQRGAHYLARAVASRPALARDGVTFAERVANEGFRIADTCGDLAEGVAFVGQVFAHLPAAAADLCGSRGLALGELYAAAAFSQFEHRNRSGTWRYAMRALWECPRLAGNRGLLSIAVQSIVGGKPWGRHRHPPRLARP